MPKIYFCTLSKTNMCRYGGNRTYNYGWWSGTGGYCWKVKEWTSNLEECPLLLVDEPAAEAAIEDQT